MYIHEDIAADKRLTLGSPYSAILLSAVAARRLSRVTDAKAKEEILALLARHDLNAEAIGAQAFLLRYTELEAAERMLASAEKRRNETLREISLRREIVARQLREKSDLVIHAENSKIPHISAPPTSITETA